MPSYNMAKILYGGQKNANSEIYNMMNDLLQIKMKQSAIDQGGEIRSSASLDPFISEYQKLSNDVSLTSDQRRSAQAKVKDLQLSKLQIDLDKNKEVSSSGLEQSVQEELRKFEFEYPNDASAYSSEALGVYRNVRNNLDELIDDLDATGEDTVSLKSYRNSVKEEINKYADIVDAGDILNNAKSSELAKNEASKRLQNYAVVYSPNNGRVNSMSIVNTSQVNPTNASPIFIKGEKFSIPVYLMKSGVQNGDMVAFGNKQFTYANGVWNTKNGEDFDLSRLQHSSIHDQSTGTFAKDSKNKLYYVNEDRTFSPVATEDMKRKLGYSDDKVYNLSQEEELNVLPVNLTNLPLSVTEEYNRQKEMINYSGWNNFVDRLRGVKEVVGSLPQRADEFINSLPEKVVGAFRANPQPKVSVPQKTEVKSFNLEGLKENPLIKQSQQFITNLKK